MSDKDDQLSSDIRVHVERAKRSGGASADARARLQARLATTAFQASQSGRPSGRLRWATTARSAGFKGAALGVIFGATAGVAFEHARLKRESPAPPAADTSLLARADAGAHSDAFVAEVVLSDASASPTDGQAPRSLSALPNSGLSAEYNKKETPNFGNGAAGALARRRGRGSGRAGTA